MSELLSVRIIAQRAAAKGLKVTGKIGTAGGAKPRRITLCDVKGTVALADAKLWRAAEFLAELPDRPGEIGAIVEPGQIVKTRRHRGGARGA